MDLTSLYYFSELSKTLNMTRTAKNLFISQQALSNHILRLEEELNVQLFQRKPTLSLTDAGEAVLAFTRAVNRERDNLDSILADLRKEERGVIRFGATRTRAEICLSEALPEVSLRYPQVQLKIESEPSDVLERWVRDGDLDIAIIRQKQDDPELVCQPLTNNPFCFCVPEGLLKRCFGTRAQEIKEQLSRNIYAQALEGLPLCMSTEIPEQKQEKWFGQFGVAVQADLVCNVAIAANLTIQGRYAGIVSHTHLYRRRNELPEDLNIFPVRQGTAALCLPLQLVWRKGRVLPRYTRCFCDRIVQVFDTLNKTDLTRVVQAEDEIRMESGDFVPGCSDIPEQYVFR